MNTNHNQYPKGMLDAIKELSDGYVTKRIIPTPQPLTRKERRADDRRIKKLIESHTKFTLKVCDALFKACVVMPDGPERMQAQRILMQAGDIYGWDAR
jgi:hypothetical protein